MRVLQFQWTFFFLAFRALSRHMCVDVLLRAWESPAAVVFVGLGVWVCDLKLQKEALHLPRPHAPMPPSLWARFSFYSVKVCCTFRSQSANKSFASCLFLFPLWTPFSALVYAHSILLLCFSASPFRLSLMLRFHILCPRQKQQLVAAAGSAENAEIQKSRITELQKCSGKQKRCSGTSQSRSYQFCNNNMWDKINQSTAVDFCLPPT